MPKNCTECGTEGGMLEVRNRKLPLSGKKFLCKNCYNSINSEEQAELNQIYKWKDELLRRFYEGTIKQYCRERAIPTYEKRWTTAKTRRGTRYRREYTHYYSYEELIQKAKVMSNIHDIIDFAQRKKVPIKETVAEMDKYYADKEMDLNKDTYQIDNEQYQQILDNIKQFQPLLSDYKNELPYQIDLARYLMQYYPTTKVELQRSSARPDIIIDDIAIEVKGPTGERELRTIADKCLRYPQYFERGFIIVAFDLQVTTRYFNDWANGLKEKFPDISILRK